jgi:hypothetical protein
MMRSSGSQSLIIRLGVPVAEDVGVDGEGLDGYTRGVVYDFLLIKIDLHMPIT